MYMFILGRFEYSICTCNLSMCKMKSINSNFINNCVTIDFQGIFNFQSKTRITTRRLQPIAKEGYLIKKSRDKKTFGSEWNKRYFILEMGQLFYSVSKEQKRKLNDSILLQGVNVVLGSKDRCIIEVQTSPILFLKASSDSEAAEWLEAFKSHIGQKGEGTVVVG